jgi:hypothetical protein
MVETSTYREEIIRELRPTLPARSATAQAIDRHETWDQIAGSAVIDGFIKLASDFEAYLAVVLWRRT